MSDRTPSGMPETPPAGRTGPHGAARASVASSLLPVDGTCRPDVFEPVSAGTRDLNRLLRRRPLQSLRDGEVLVEAGRPAAAVYRLNRGLAFRTRQVARRRTILDVYLPGDLIGLEAVLCRHAPDAVVMAAAGGAHVLAAAELLPLVMTNPAVTLGVAWAASEAQRRVEAMATALRRLDGEARIALALLEFHGRLHRRQLLSGPHYSLQLTQSELGDYVGMTAIHVNRVLRGLRERQIVAFEKQLVLIMNREALMRLAEGNPAGLPAPS
jgi:CRP-like cAMP-binding protein